MDHRDVPVPSQLASRPRDSRGYVISFVTFVDRKTGEPDFPVLDPERVARCANHRLCGLCGLPLGRLACFIGGEESVEHRMFADPAMHVSCARYATKVCPYLNSSNVQRKPPRQHEGVALLENPLAGKERPKRMAIYQTRHFEPILVAAKPGDVPALNFKVGKPYHVEWFL